MLFNISAIYQNTFWRKKKKGIHGQFRVQTTSIFLVLVEVTVVADIGQGFLLVR